MSPQNLTTCRVHYSTWSSQVTSTYDSSDFSVFVQTQKYLLHLKYQSVESAERHLYVYSLPWLIVRRTISVDRNRMWRSDEWKNCPSDTWLQAKTSPEQLGFCCVTDAEPQISSPSLRIVDGNTSFCMQSFNTKCFVRWLLLAAWPEIHILLGP